MDKLVQRLVALSKNKHARTAALAGLLLKLLILAVAFEPFMELIDKLAVL